MWKRGRVWGAKLQPATTWYIPQHYTWLKTWVEFRRFYIRPMFLNKQALGVDGVFESSSPVIHRSGSWCPGPPRFLASWWNCWTCCWGRHSHSCLCTFCGVYSWTRSHRLAVKTKRRTEREGDVESHTAERSSDDTHLVSDIISVWLWIYL